VEEDVLYFLYIISTFEEARRVLGVDYPPADQLPQSSQMSDLAWGAWRRVHPDGQDLNDINMFSVALILVAVSVDSKT
jgi:hypothetical protein